MKNVKTCTPSHLENSGEKLVEPLSLKPRSGPPEPMDALVEGRRCVLISLTQNKLAIIDLMDADRIKPFVWHAYVAGTPPNIRWYAKRRASPKEISDGWPRNIRMHNWIMGIGVLGDHKNHDGLDNRRQNLRAVSPFQNHCNTRTRADSSTGLKGVGWHKHVKKWVARITSKGARTHLGYYNNPIDAAVAYNNAAVKRWGEFAELNNIPTP